VRQQRRQNMTIQRTTGQALVEGLVAHGVDTVFGIPGVQTYPLFDALAEHSVDLSLIVPRHEQSCGYMAMGYTQSTGRPGVCTVVPGPGVLNASAALLTALGTCAPVVTLTSEVPSAYIGRGMGHLHEMRDQLSAIRQFTKWAENILRPEDAPALLAQAFYQARSGKPGPAVVAAPWDILAATGSGAPVPPLPFTPPVPDRQALHDAVELLAAARNPMIMVGGGARDAGPAVRALARSGAGELSATTPGVSDCHSGRPTARGFLRRGDMPDGIQRPFRISRRPVTALHHGRVSGHAGIRLSDEPRRQGRVPLGPGRVHHR
jgi:acetolactate synthase-1/2/3 large subunit